MADTASSYPGSRGLRRATINDVAREAGVSRQTVSNVLRNRGRVGDKTRQRVVGAIEALGYVTHPGASSLRSGRTLQVAHPMPAMELDPGNAIAIEFVQALVAAAGERDLHILLTASHGESGEVEDLIRSGRVDGFIFSTLEPGDQRLALLAERRFPFACFGRTVPALPQSWVDVDNAEGIRMAVQHLVDEGHTEIAFLGYDGKSYWDYERIDGYREALEALDLRPRTYLCRNNPAAITATVDQLLESAAPATAVVTGSDALAGAVYAAAATRGLVIGRGFAVTGFDGSVIGRSLVPRLTTLAIPVSEIAVHVVGRLLREIDSPTGEPGEFLPLTLVRGESA